MEKLNNFNQEEKDFIINLGLFSYQQHEEFFNNKLSNKYLSNNLEASFTNSNIELMNEIEKLKEDIKNKENIWQQDKINLQDNYSEKINVFQDRISELINDKNNELREERERNYKIQQDLKNEYMDNFEKLNNEKICLLTNFNKKLDEEVEERTHILNNKIQELAEKNNYYYNLYVDKNKGKKYEEVLLEELENLNNLKYNNSFEINHVGSAISGKADFQIVNKITKKIILLDTKNNIATKPVSKTDIDKFVKDVTLPENNAIGGVLIANNQVSGKSVYELNRVNNKLLVYVSNFDFSNADFVFSLLMMIESMNSETCQNFNKDTLKLDFRNQYNFIKERINNLNNEKKKLTGQIGTLSSRYYSLFEEDIEVENSKTKELTVGKEKIGEEKNLFVNFEELEKDRTIIGKRSKYYLRFEEDGISKIQYFIGNNPKSKKMKQLEKNEIIINKEPIMNIETDH